MSVDGSYSDTTARYSASLTVALDHFRTLVANPHSRSWKLISSSSAAPSPIPATPAATSTSTSHPTHPLLDPNASSSAGGGKGKNRAPSSSFPSSSSQSSPPPLPTPDDLLPGLAPLPASSVVVHRKTDKERGGPEILRAVGEVWIEEARADEVLERARAVLGTGEVRGMWDKLVEQQTTLELLDPQTRIVKTDYRLGWPASPRDTIIISRTFLTPSPSSPSSSSSSSSSTAYYSPGSTLIDLSTSIPRAPDPSDEPAFLRPAPPFVRAHLHLGAWGLQVVPPSPSSSSAAPAPQAPPGLVKLRLTLFWQWTLRLSSPSSSSFSPTSSSSSSTQAKHAQDVLSSFVALLRSSTPGGGAQLPLLRGYGRGVEMNRDEYEVAGEIRRVEYAVVKVPGAGVGGAGGGEAGEEEEDGSGVGGNLQGLDELARRRERRRLERSVELSLPPLGVLFPPIEEGGTGVEGGAGVAAGGSGGDGWDVRIAVKALGGPAAPLASCSSSVPLTPSLVPSSISLAAPGEIDTSFTVSLSALSSPSSPPSLFPAGRLTLRVTHPPLLSPAHLLRCAVTVQRLAGGKCVRVNGVRKDVERVEVRDPFAASLSVGGGKGEWGGGEDGASLRTTGTGSSGSSSSPAGDAPLDSAVSLRSVATGATTTNPSASALAAHQRRQQLQSLLRRSYIYFLSLLQEPPAKWRHVSDSSGVTVTQLLSPDPTLTIYRAEAVFVGVGVWDVYATVVSWGVRRGWDKGVEGVELVPEPEREGGVGEEGGEGEGEGEEGGMGLSEVWWERRKGQWPVAPRDSVLLRTSYKSPSSIHVFSSSPPSPSSSSSDPSSPSSSSPSTSLFPHLPPPAPGTIRTHTDLSGWSIEALSPTTTQITLLDQSDPKGWTTKSSWTPGAMVQAVAGVRDWSIRNGAPPVVTRLSGGVRKVREEYEVERAQLRVEYAPVSSSSSSSGACLPSSPDPSSSTSPAPPSLHDHPSSPPRTELEIRCDSTVWALSSSGGIEVLVDPPPVSVACLSRHRLSAGGGLWLTVEHDKRVVRKEGRVVVTVRRASSSSSPTVSSSSAAAAKGALPPGGVAVTVNGARVKVDVEVLDDEKVRELEKRKRVKARPVPLDQYETLGPRVGGGGAVVAAAAPATGMVGKEKQGGGERQRLEKEGAEKGEGGKVVVGGGAGPSDDPQVGLLAAAGDVATGSTAVVGGDALLSAAELSSTSPSSPSTGADALSTPSPPQPPLDPPACALEALAYLQTFHAEQGPELTDPAPGWAIASERGGAVVRKKLLPRLSPELPVYRGDKIVQGLTADEVAAVVSATGCRKQWDERIESAVPLASYGHGITTAVLTTKPVFPFKGRAFYVASVNASVKVPSASSAASTSTVRFVASASYTPSFSSTSSSASDPFDPLKTNPSSLPLGTVHLEGWILETLDPYTSSVLAIPSTRCTYVSCVDPKLGQLALGLGQVNLARTIGNVERWGKEKGPVVRLVRPVEGVQVEGPLSDEEEGGREGDGGEKFVWRLEREKKPEEEEGRSEVVVVDYDPTGASAQEGAFRALFRVEGKERRKREASAGSEGGGGDAAGGLLERKASEKASSTTSGGGGGAGKNKPSTMLSPSMPVGSTLLRSELPRSASLNFGTAAPPVLQKPPIIPELAHKGSRSSLRSRSPPGGTTTSVPSVVTPVSSSSSTSAATKMNGSSTTITDPAAHDLVVAELVIDLKQYPHGYSVVASSLLVSSTTTDEPLSLEPLPPRSLVPSSSSSSSPTASTAPTQIPLRCTAHDAPLPSILTASLDAWKRANHLVRVLVPTGAITHPIQDPLRTPDASSPSVSLSGASNKPEWFRLLTEGEGALVELKIVPLPAPPPSLSAAGKAKERERARAEQEAGGAGKVTGQAARSAVFNGEKVVVMSQKESKGVLARFEDDDAPVLGAKISRAPPRKRRKPSIAADSTFASPHNLLPLELQQPLAVASRLLAPKPVTPVLTDDFEFPDPKSPGNVTPADDGARSPVLGGKKSIKPAQLSRRDTASSADSPLAHGAAGPLLNILNSYPLSRLGTSVINATAPVVVTESTTMEGGAVAVRRTYTLSFVLLAGVIAFLLGSLLRSLLTPADYIIYRPDSAAQHGAVEQALLQAFDPHRKWKEARRLLELRSAWGGWFGWDIIVAAVKRD
ncbi:hypothetical protein JCM8547_000556 [Rhodosporidiobolus lusitaniae]